MSKLEELVHQILRNRSSRGCLLCQVFLPENDEIANASVSWTAGERQGKDDLVNLGMEATMQG